MQTHLSIIISGPEETGEGVDVRCSLVEQDTRNRSSCPNGQKSIIDTLKRAAGLTVASVGQGDGIFRMPILVQDRSGYQSSLSLSHGGLEDNGVVSRNRTINISLSLSDAVDSGVPGTPYKVDLAAKIKSATDLEIDFLRTVTAPGKLLNSAGDTVYNSGSPLTTTGDFVLLRDKVVGKISVSYVVSGIEKVAVIPPREDATEYNYQSTLWVVSSCGEIQHFEIEGSDCWQQAWWRDNGYHGDLLDDGGGDAEVIEPPNYADGDDKHFNWLVCGDKPAADQQTADYFKDAPGSGVVVYPGVKFSTIKNIPNRCGDNDDEWVN